MNDGISAEPPEPPIVLPVMRWTTGTEGKSSSVFRTRRRCSQLIDELELPDDLDMVGLVSHVGLRLGLQLQVLPVQLGPRLSGLTLLGGDRGVILVPKDTTPYRQVLIAAHETGHLAFGHQLTQDTTKEAAELLTQFTDPAQMSTHFTTGFYARHHGYDRPAELEAEEFSTQVAVRLPLLASPDRTPELDRLRPSLEHRSWGDS